MDQGRRTIYDVVPATSPDPGWITAWLVARGFVTGGGDQRRRVRERTPKLTIFPFACP
jgi:hypothetical protein